MLSYFVILFCGCAVIGGALAALTWKITRRIHQHWLRHLLRAIAVAVAFTPTIVPIPSLHGAWPMPAAVALFFGVVGGSGNDRFIDLIYGGVPLLVASLILWFAFVTMSYVKRKYPAAT